MKSPAVLGPDHPCTVATRSALALWRAAAGDAAGAATAYEELLTDYMRVLGPDHPSTLAARHNLAFWRGEARRVWIPGRLPDTARVDALHAVQLQNGSQGVVPGLR
jgi:hypothetical protein